MYSTCIFCLTRFGSNTEIEHFPVGGRLAFDSDRGRLWVVCRRCERWNLAPIEQRWEAIETCERLFRSTKARYSTENIGIARTKAGLDLVRIGRPLRREFAHWRYGDQFGRRRRLAVVRTSIGVAGTATVLIAGGITFGSLGTLALLSAWFAPRIYETAKLIGGFRYVHALEASDRLLAIRRRHLPTITLEKSDVGPEGSWLLAGKSSGGAWEVDPQEALQAAYLFLPAINSMGANSHDIDLAVAELNSMESPSDLFRKALGDKEQVRLSSLPTPLRLGLEMATAEGAERAALEDELHRLESVWRRAEEIAAIADGLTASAAVEKKLNDLRSRRGL